MPTDVIIYAAAAFVLGFAMAWLIRSLTVSKAKRSSKEVNSLLANEKLIKETQRKESLAIQQHQQAKEIELEKRLREKDALLKEMDINILLLQKSNDETEDLLKARSPEIHALKLKLLEAQNTIARLKSRLGEK